MNRGHCSPCPGLHFKAFPCGIVNVGSCERALSPAGRESTFLRSRLFSVLNSCPMAGCAFTAKTSPKMEAVFLGLYHYNTTAALSFSSNLHLVGPRLVGAWLMDGFTVSLLSHLKPMNPSPCGPFLQTTTTAVLGLQPGLPHHHFHWPHRPPSEKMASPCNLFQLLQLPWSVDLVKEHTPSLTSVCLLSGTAGSRSA